MDAAQRMAFDYNATNFLVWTEELDPQFVLTFATAGYTSAIAGDIGKAVVGATSGATGVLVSYDNTAKTWNITSTNDIDFRSAEAVSITTGTGAGTLGTTSTTVTPFAGFAGPYDAPEDPPCRKIWGVTAETDARIFGTDLSLDLQPMDDFDFMPRVYDPTRFFKAGREDNVNGQFTFAEAAIPFPSAQTTLRWVYWQDSPTIDGTADETQLKIPARYHMNFINACIKLAQMNISGEDVDPKMIDALFQPWWNTLARPYTPMGVGSNQTLNPRGSADSFL